MIDVTLRCVPPSVTAQQKQARIVRAKNGKMIPVFFHGKRMQAETATWTDLLKDHVPPAPLDGPLVLWVRLVYPHLAATKKAQLGLLLPKISKPDAGNASKHLEDLLTKLRFIADDARVARLTVEKFHGPEAEVGIRIRIYPFPNAHVPLLPGVN